MTTDKAIALQQNESIGRLTSTAIMMDQKLMADLDQFAGMLTKSNLVPRDFAGKKDTIRHAILRGLDLGIPPLQALEAFVVIHGKVTIFGDHLLATIKNHPQCLRVFERIEGSWEDDDCVAICEVTRKDDPDHPIVRRFSKKDAQRAGLTERSTTWKQYPQRMLQMRARSWACRDAIPEALSGMGMAEEARDYQTIDIQADGPMGDALNPEVLSPPDIPPPSSDELSATDVAVADAAEAEISEDPPEAPPIPTRTATPPVAKTPPAAKAPPVPTGATAQNPPPVGATPAPLTPEYATSQMLVKIGRIRAMSGINGCLREILDGGAAVLGVDGLKECRRALWAAAAAMRPPIYYSKPTGEFQDVPPEEPKESLLDPVEPVAEQAVVEGDESPPAAVVDESPVAFLARFAETPPTQLSAFVYHAVESVGEMTSKDDIAAVQNFALSEEAKARLSQGDRDDIDAACRMRNVDLLGP